MGRSVAPAADPERAQRVLFAFMYVYYGNPLLTVEPPESDP